MASGGILSAVLIGAAVGLAAPADDDAPIPPGLSNAEVAEHAEEAFRTGVGLRDDMDRARPHFRTAARYFEELRRRGANNPTLYRNLGNAQLLAGDLPAALVSYHRGLRLAPYDRDLRARLDAARGQVDYPPESPARLPGDDRPAWWPPLPPEYVFGIAVVLYLAAWVCVTRWLMTRQRRPLLTGGLILLAAVGLTAWVIAASRAERAAAARPLVVITDNEVWLRTGNGPAYSRRGEAPLKRGVEARLLFERGGWLQVELTGGEVGWVPRTAALVDRP